LLRKYIMNISAQNPLLFTEAVLWLFFLVGLSILIFQYWKLQKKLDKTQHEKQLLEATTHEQSLHLLDRARLQALSIIEQAQLKAQDIMKTAQITQVEVDATLHQSLAAVTKTQAAALSKTSNELIADYEANIKQVEQDDIKMFKNVSKKIEETAATEIDTFKEILAKETTSSQKIVEEKIEHAYQDSLKDIEEQKKEKLSEIDTKMFEYIQDVTKKFLGAALTDKDHQGLILQALTEAKKDNKI
jgi:hypothetical protein